ncbi:Hypothetical protein PHPALM_20405 [Phytophthora palmivora]|uniref:Uncharacterized protein n=1 Tax=Phytophthora palmivora TaxID=4796 RepID=A0A2P4XEY4_9STRA|nr:Hypothetical protein PHPALM_20405 [Phytophthora palmivora]
MDLALTIVDGLRQIFELRDAIRRQRRENRKTYVQMMEIYVELQLSAPLQANPTLQRTATITKFAAAVTAFSSHLRKYHDMHPVVRMFKHTSMEEKRLKIVDEIDQLYRMLNLATAVTVMNGQASASMNAAKLFAKLEEMHGDIRLTHDEIHAAFLTRKQHLDVTKEKVLPGQEPVAGKCTSNRVVAERHYLTRQAPIKKEKNVRAVVKEKFNDETSPHVVENENVINDVEQSRVTTQEEEVPTAAQPALTTESMVEEVPQANDSVEAEVQIPVAELEQGVVGEKTQQNGFAELEQSTDIDDAEKEGSVGMQSTLTKDIASEAAEVKEENESTGQTSQLQPNVSSISDDSTLEKSLYDPFLTIH